MQALAAPFDLAKQPSDQPPLCAAYRSASSVANRPSFAHAHFKANGYSHCNTNVTPFRDTHEASISAAIVNSDSSAFVSSHLSAVRHPDLVALQSAHLLSFFAAELLANVCTFVFAIRAPDVCPDRQAEWCANKQAFSLAILAAHFNANGWPNFSTIKQAVSLAILAAHFCADGWPNQPSYCTPNFTPNFAPVGCANFNSLRPTIVCTFGSPDSCTELSAYLGPLEQPHLCADWISLSSSFRCSQWSSYLPSNIVALRCPYLFPLFRSIG